MAKKAPKAIKYKVITIIPNPEQIKLKYNLHLSSLDSALLANISARDWFCKNLRLFCIGWWWMCFRVFFLRLWTPSRTTRSSKSSPSCFRLVMKQSNSIMVALITTNGRQAAAKIIGNINNHLTDNNQDHLKFFLFGMETLMSRPTRQQYRRKY